MKVISDKKTFDIPGESVMFCVVKRWIGGYNLVAVISRDTGKIDTECIGAYVSYRKACREQRAIKRAYNKKKDFHTVKVELKLR